MRARTFLGLAWALAALPLAGQTTAGAARPGWIGFFAGVEQTAPGAPAFVVVLAVAEGSPAARAGLGEGDTLLAVDGEAPTPEGLKLVQAGLRAGDRVQLTVRRDGTSRTLSVRAEPRPTSATGMPDPVEIRVGSARKLMLRADSVDRVAAAAPGARRILVRIPEPPEAPEPDWGTPFSVHVFGDARTDSLTAALRDVERRLVAVRSAESARVRELAARVRPGGRIDATDRALGEARTRREALTTERSLLRAMLDRIVAERVDGAMAAAGAQMGWMEFGPPPYIAGRDRVAGARVTALNPALAEYFGTARGVLIVEIAPGTPADEAGLRPGDVVLRVAGVDVDGLEALRRAVAAAPVDQPVAVTLLRKGTRVQVALPR